MSGSVKIVLARKDLSIPGAPENLGATQGRSNAVEAHFFDLVDDNKPDVIVLDCGEESSAAIDTVRKVRQRTDVPIIVLCRLMRPLIEQYRGAGAADCVASPVELAVLNQSIQRIIDARRQQTRVTAGRP